MLFEQDDVARVALRPSAPKKGRAQTKRGWSTDADQKPSAN